MEHADDRLYGEVGALLHDICALKLIGLVAEVERGVSGALDKERNLRLKRLVHCVMSKTLDGIL